MKTLKTIFTTALVTAVLCVVGYFGIQHMKAPEPNVIVLGIEGTVQEIGELSTAEYIYTVTDTCEKPNKKIAKFKIPLTASSVIFEYSGVIKAGINFEQVKIDVDDASKRIAVTLPEITILSNELDQESLKIYDEKNNPFNQITITDLNQSQVALKQKAEETAAQNGLMETAEENAKTILLSTIGSLCNLEEYEVIFR